MNNVVKIIDELQGLATNIKQEELIEIADAIIQARYIFVVGAGRSGFTARGFANRLLHLGFPVSFVGEPTTPRLQKEDLLIIASGSGKTSGLVKFAEKAKEIGATIATLTINPQATIGQMAQHIVTIPGTTRLHDNNDGSLSMQPIGSAFEQLLWLTFDAIVLILMEKTKQKPEDLIERHGNLE